MIRISLVLFIALIAPACGGGGYGRESDGGAAVQYQSIVTNEALGGFWQGTDSNGDTVIALTTDDGEFHWISDSGEQGFGTGLVSGTDVTLDLALLTRSYLGITFGDGSDSASCTGTGTIAEGDTLAVNIGCTTSLGGSFSNFVAMAYSPLYDRDSTLLSVAGNYEPDTHADLDNPGEFKGLVTIDDNGVIFEQDPDSGCVINGQVSLIDSQFNAYEVSVTFSSCTGAYLTIDNFDGRFGPDPVIELLIPNGTTLTGLGILDNTVLPEEFGIALAGEVAGTGSSIAVVVSLIRL